MMAINSTSRCNTIEPRPLPVSSHDASQNSVNVPHLQLLKHPIFSENCTQVERNTSQSEVAEHEPVGGVSLDKPTQWIIRACQGLWEQIKLEEKQPGERIDYGQQSGSGLIDGLIHACGKSDRLLAVGMCQILLDESAIGLVPTSKVNKEEQGEFQDRDDVFYQCTCPPEQVERDLTDGATVAEDVAATDNCCLASSSAPDEKLNTSTSPAPVKVIAFRTDSLELDDTPQLEDRFQILMDRLYGLASDVVLRRILLKKPSLRNSKELDFVFHELHLVPALSGFSRNVRHELSRCLLYEIHPKAGTTVFNQGDPGTSWYIIHRGSVWVYVKEQGRVCRLSEGDDFGKLALVTGAPRAASIVLAEDNCHFLKVEKDDFDRILRDVEANIIRLKEKDSDVLILERLLDSDGTKSNDTSPSHKIEVGTMGKKMSTTGRLINHSIKAGTVEKVVQHLLDLRLGGMEHQIDTLLDSSKTPLHLCPQLLTNVDQTFEDFILTYTLFTTDETLFDLLMTYAQQTIIIGNFTEFKSPMDASRVNRVLVFLYCWCQCVGLSLFTKADRLREFLQELQVFIDDHFPESIQSQIICRLMEEYHMIRFPLYIEGGRKQHWLTMQLNCTVADIKLEMTTHLSENTDISQYKLVEVSSKGERVVFDDCERGVVLGLSPNSCLFMVEASKVRSLAPLPIQLTVAMNFLEHHELERYRSNQELHHKDMKSGSPMLRRMASTGMSFRALDELTVEEVATILTMASVRVAACIGPKELIEYTLGSKKSDSATAHIRLLISHFSLIHTWTITQVVTCTSVSRRAQLLKKLIKIADRLIDAPFFDQHTCFAIVLGLHSSPVTRLTHTWERVPMRWRRVYFNRLVPLIDPARNHRAARTWIVSTQPPHLPFLALVLKDLRFAEDANQTNYSEQTGAVRLINFDKMRLVAQSLRLWNRAMAGYDWFHPQSGKLKTPLSFDYQSDPVLYQKVQDLSLDHLQLFFENLECIDDIRVLTQLSLRLEPKRC
ncbi:unnamed protein product [Echinostoma caproni]|uniref:cGMP-dependent protein kinase n=1 Tax=Echinostoma caproni TaxID=27848 RepID=A0A183ABB1_9TREM|nr:unnamed protein product [Echinostoma caproni]